MCQLEYHMLPSCFFSYGTLPLTDIVRCTMFIKCFYLLGTTWDHMSHMVKTGIGWSETITCRNFGITGHQRCHWSSLTSRIRGYFVLGSSNLTFWKICPRRWEICYSFKLVASRKSQNMIYRCNHGNTPKCVLDKWLVFVP